MRVEEAASIVTLTVGAGAKLMSTVPFWEISEFGSTVLLGVFLLYFMFRYLPRQEERQDKKDAAFLAMLTKKDQESDERLERIRKEDADRRHKENGALQHAFLSLEKVVEHQLGTLNDTLRGQGRTS